MAISFVARKCACGGKLEFDATKKIWICKYCGTVIEREATFDKIKIDGIEGINDVVRQTLFDIAYLKMDQASKNLEDCERKDHRHIGTLIANLSFNLVGLTASKSEVQMHGHLDKVKIYAKRLREEFPVITEAEINLYESFGDTASDIYANLAVSFDTIGDGGRSEYLLTKLKADEVFSSYANKILLKYSIKNNKFELVDKIIANRHHIDKTATLQEILDKYPSSERKKELIDLVFDPESANELTKKYFENYYSSSEDSLDIKAKLLSHLNKCGLRCATETIIKGSSDQLTDYSKARRLFESIYEVKVADSETEALMLYCLVGNPSYELQAAFLDTLAQYEVYVAIRSRTIISYLDYEGMDINKKVVILQKMLSFQIENKDLDSVCNHYLNNNMSNQEERLLILDSLLYQGFPISSNTVRNYIVNTTTDKNYKKQVIEKIISTGIEKVYLGNILSEYLIGAKDEQPQRREIFEFLISQGFNVDSAAFINYICSEEDKNLKFETAKQLIQSGTLVRADTLDYYILSLRNSQEFSEDIFHLLLQCNCIIHSAAFARYLLECSDINKVGHSHAILDLIVPEELSRPIQIFHLNDSLECNIAQSYLLISKDGYNITAMILAKILSRGIKLNTDILVNGSNIKFKKYVGNQRAFLSPLSLQLSEENKLFSLF